jgi:hypothetical protein
VFLRGRNRMVTPEGKEKEESRRKEERAHPSLNTILTIMRKG